jgi:hypothetical protein
MEAVGGPQTYVLGGAFNCGKGQPGQVAAVSCGIVGAEAVEAPGLPGAMTRRFEAFERSPEHEAPLA